MIRHLRQAVYTLKHRYPTSIVLVQISSTGVNTRTGARSLVQGFTTVRKAVKMNISAKQKFSYDLGYVHNNVNFTYGNIYNLAKLVFLIDRADLPRGYEVKSKMYLLCAGLRFMVDDVETFDEGPHFGAYMLTCTRVDALDAVFPLVTTLTLTDDWEVVP